MGIAPVVTQTRSLSRCTASWAMTASGSNGKGAAVKIRCTLSGDTANCPGGQKPGTHQTAVD
jgi:hypothetical protein